MQIDHLLSHHTVRYHSMRIIRIGNSPTHVLPSVSPLHSALPLPLSCPGAGSLLHLLLPGSSGRSEGTSQVSKYKTSHNPLTQTKNSHPSPQPEPHTPALPPPPHLKGVSDARAVPPLQFSLPLGEQVARLFFLLHLVKDWNQTFLFRVN